MEKKSTIVVPEIKVQKEEIKGADSDTLPPLRYKPIFKQPQHYIKLIGKVYETFEDFDFKQVDYEITEIDRNWLSKQTMKIEPQELEKMIDLFEKI